MTPEQRQKRLAYLRSVLKDSETKEGEAKNADDPGAMRRFVIGLADAGQL